MKLARLPHILGILFITGCSDIPEIPSYELSEVGADVACGSDNSCMEGEICVADRCVIISNEIIDVAIRMSFPQARDVPVISYHQLIPGDSVGAFTMPKLQPVKFYVKYRDAWIDGNLSITPSNTWTGIDAEQKGLLSVNGKNELPVQMIPGTYNITVFPADITAELPTMYFEHVQIDSDTSEVVFDLSKEDEIDNMLPAGNVDLICRLSTPNINASTSDISLTIKDQDSPASSAHYTLNSDSTRNPLPVWLPPQSLYGPRNYQIRTTQNVTPTLTINQVLQDFVMDPFTQEEDDNHVVYGDVVSLDIQTFSSAEIRGRVMCNAAVGPAGAKVTITGSSRDNNLTWTSRSHEETSNDGYFILDMPQEIEPSDCTIRVVYPSDSPLASQSIQTQCPFATDELVIDIDNKTAFAGTVFNESTHTPVDNAHIVFTPTDHIGSDIEIFSKSDGTFEVALDAKIYQVSINAPRANGLPPITTLIDGSDPKMLNFSLKRGELIYGTCLTDDGEPAADVRTEVYVLQNGTAKRLNVTESDSTGTFRLFIPELSTLKN